MRLPDRPPSFSDHERWPLKQLVKITAQAQKAELGSQILVQGKYLHWDKVRHLSPPEGLTHEEWWWVISSHRRPLFRDIPLLDRKGRPFRFAMIDPVHKILREIDSMGAGWVTVPSPITNPQTKDRYIVKSLMEEAITSSQIEGATTTRAIAQEMLRTGREPRDQSERMIVNNFRAMQQIGTIRNEALSKQVIFEIHRTLTEGTLKDPSLAGRLRRNNEKERVEVVDTLDEVVLHHPPPARELAKRVSKLCEFANGTHEDPYIHPVVQSIILHFWLAYDHPFVDGNGRTARSLFYWSMLRQGYWLFEFTPISAVIRKSPTAYARAFLETETDENDLTYFIIYHLEVIKKAIEELHRYIERKTDEIKRIDSEIRDLSFLNHRQEAIIAHALRHPNQIYTVRSHQQSHRVVYQTARQDLLSLVDLGLLRKDLKGKQFQFRPAPNLATRLKKLNTAR